VVFFQVILYLSVFIHFPNIIPTHTTHSQRTVNDNAITIQPVEQAFFFLNLFYMVFSIAMIAAFQLNAQVFDPHLG
jgi:hypothetical protein